MYKAWLHYNFTKIIELSYKLPSQINDKVLFAQNISKFIKNFIRLI